MEFNGKTLYCCYRNDEEVITDLIVLENNNYKLCDYEYSCRLNEYVLLLFLYCCYYIIDVFVL